MQVPRISIQGDGILTILWDYYFQTEHIIEHRRSVIFILNDRGKYFQIIDVAILNDLNVVSKVVEKKSSTISN